MPKEFLGRGWKFPIVPNEAGKIATSEFEQDIREAIRLILLTARGERVMRPDFGAGLNEFVFSTMSATNLGAVQLAVQEALINWEPRIQVLKVTVAPEHGEIGKLLINIDY